jgi:hypothetical protein
MQVRFLAVFRWVEACQQWRLLDPRNKSLIQEFNIYECKFMQKIVERLELSKDKDNLIKIELSRLTKKEPTGWLEKLFGKKSAG